MDTFASYGALPGEHDDYGPAKIVIVPVPYDRTSTYVKGADKGPGAMLEASGHMELYDIETDSEVYKEGIATDLPVAEQASPERLVEAVQQRVAAHLDKGKFVVVAGGEHTVSVGAVRAHAARFPGLSVLHFDAHADLRQEFEGSPYNHACAMARIRESCPIVQVGIRSMDAEEKLSLDRGRVFFAEDIRGTDGWMDRAVGLLSGNVYVTIDLDVFDPAVFPATGTPEPGGLDWHQVLAVLRKVAARKTIVGFDVVEHCPMPGNKGPDFLVAKLIYKILSYRFKGGAHGKERHP